MEDFKKFSTMKDEPTTASAGTEQDAAQELAEYKVVIEELIPLAEFTKFKTAKDIEIIERARKLIDKL